ncbi:PREDICTED: G-type lectin S-receptor [Prunus dulcis]|uniref:PREDICTED: G-type lectin S-receptor n=1 Tax=Prunus dulcis TaxID=3755 RepID=A0A5E4GKG5_PRUDU|nr:PREDICTED: G-type lectin S-receptor [Prunus dulcis]
MACLACLLALAFVAAEAQQMQSNISQGSSLTPTTNSTWLSRSGLYAFGFYRQGDGYAVGIFLAGIPEKTVVWTANRDDPLVSNDATLVFTGDGLTLLTAEGQNYFVKSMSDVNGDCELNESVAPRRYAYEELEKMTNNFKEELGRGASSIVYKGLILGSQKPVAVKRKD